MERSSSWVAPQSSPVHASCRIPATSLLRVPLHSSSGFFTFHVTDQSCVAREPPRSGGVGQGLNEKEIDMKKLLIGSAAAAALLIAVPASAQVYFGADPYGAGVQVGPLGAGVGAYGYRDSDCRIIRERTVTPSGRMIIQTHRVCD
jgi:hypothetical protein